MSFEDAAAALVEAQEADDAGTSLAATPPAPEQAPVAPVSTPEGESAPQVQPDQFNRDELGRFARFEQEQAEAAAEQTVQDTFDGGKFNPDTLPPELQDAWKQLQAAYTQKTQEVAEQRKQFEGIDAAEARQAVELYQALQDPNYLVQFHSQLSEALQAQGLTPAQADVRAAQELGTTAPEVAQAGDALAALRGDPELAPVAELVGSLKSELEALKASQANAEQRYAAEQMELAIAGEFFRQESVLREQGLSEKHIEHVKQLAPFFDGSLIDAAEAFKGLREETLIEYLESKQTVAPGVAPVQNSQTTSEVPTELGDMDEALKAALTHIESAGIDTVV